MLWEPIPKMDDLGGGSEEGLGFDIVAERAEKILACGLKFCLTWGCAAEWSLLE